MGPGDAMDAMRACLWTLVLVATPVLLPVLIAGLVAGILQAATSVNEAVLALVPKLIATVMALALFGTFMIARLVELFGDLAARIPEITR